MAFNGSKRSKTEAASAAADEDCQLLSDEVLVSIEQLQEAQEELAKITAEAKEKISAIEKKYNDVKEPVLVRRNVIISKIPDFWLTSFLSHPKLGALLTWEDRKIFSFMDTLHVENFNDMKRGYCITFNFKANPYFENDKLSKTIKFSDDGSLTSMGTIINWKAGMDPTDGSYEMKEGNEQPSPQNSFFTWFSFPPEYVLEVDQDLVAEVIKEELWVNPIEHLTYDEDDIETGEDEEDKDKDVMNSLSSQSYALNDEEDEGLEKGGSSGKIDE